MMASADHTSITAPQLGTAERDQIAAVLESGTIADGPGVRGLEQEFADYCEAGHGVATSNGTMALHTAPHILGVGPGDRALMTPFMFITMANAVAFAGAEVGFVDIDPRTYNIDPDTLEARLRANEWVDTATAIHLYGLPADMTRLAEFAAKYDFLLAEDAAQTHGTVVEGRRIDSFDDATYFSLYPAKNMTMNEGGMIATNRADVTRRATWFVDRGHISDYEHVGVGHNFHMTSIIATVSRAQLEHFLGFAHTRQANAAAPTGYPEDSLVTTPHTPPGRTHVLHQYTVACDGTERDVLKPYLDTKGTAAGVYYPKPIHKQPTYEHLAVSAPIVEETATRILSPPVHPGPSEADVERVGTTVASCAEVAR